MTLNPPTHAARAVVDETWPHAIFGFLTAIVEIAGFNRLQRNLAGVEQRTRINKEGALHAETVRE